MMREFDELIDRLADDAVAVKPMRTGVGRAMLAAVAVTTIVLVEWAKGLRSDVAAMSPQPILAVSLGLFAILAIAAGTSAVRMARPQVGAMQSGALWALATMLLLPLAAIIALAANPTLTSGLEPHQGMRCLTIGLVAGSGTLAMLGLWLRNGAPVAVERSAWFAGLAAGAVGAIANSLDCPIDAITHLGIWHVSEVIVGGLIGRVILPPLVRW